MVLKYLFFIIIIPVSCFVFSQNKSQPPNILFIMSDDHAVNAIGAYNSWLKPYLDTPNIDRLAEDGVLFTNVHCTNALCAPSRATIISGAYSHQTGVYTLRESLNTKDKMTVPKVLQANGYRTAVFGKWHIHGDNLYGFDYYEITNSQGNYRSPSLRSPNGKQKYEGYATDVYTDLSIQWLSEHNEKPFFLMVNYKAVHAPWIYAERHEAMYEDQNIPEPNNLNDQFSGRSPYGLPKFQNKIHDPEKLYTSLSFWFQEGKKGKGSWPTGNINLNGKTDSEQLQMSYQKYIKDYLRTVKGIDEGVGQLVAYLKKQNILDNTVIIFTSDQGMFLGEHGFFDKRLGLKEAEQMPLIIRCPKFLNPKSKQDILINNVDFAKTLVAMGGVNPNVFNYGHSFWKYIQGKQELWPRERSFYGFYSNGAPKHYGIITESYKYLKYTDKNGNILGTDLFDRKNDLNEMHNLSAHTNYKQHIKVLEASLQDEMKAIGIRTSQLPGKKK
jgi:uncharacterized sulfatase